MEALLQFLDSIYPLSPALRHQFLVTLKNKRYLKKQYLLKSGHVCRRMFFIETGLVRCFYERNEKEVSSWFMKEGDVFMSVESFYQQLVSFENIQALEDCQVYYIEYTELQSMYRSFPESNFIARVLTEKYYLLSEQRLSSMRLQRSFERYQYMMDCFPELVQRVPSKYIASYLGVTEETLSRIRSRKCFDRKM